MRASAGPASTEAVERQTCLPAEVEDRAVPGRRESDLVMGVRSSAQRGVWAAERLLNAPRDTPVPTARRGIEARRRTGVLG
ncbi:MULTISPECIES: hypothetical protein [unclassified Streptomyces]|uniref:hypothetical protein n=1 Tax=unclassified Streptomyces TaxID=2593676 RepID=UPI0035D911F1